MKEKDEMLEKYRERLVSDIEFWESKIRQLESSIHYYETKIQDANTQIKRIEITGVKIEKNQDDLPTFITAQEMANQINREQF